MHYFISFASLGGLYYKLDGRKFFIMNFVSTLWRLTPGQIQHDGCIADLDLRLRESRKFCCGTLFPANLSSCFQVLLAICERHWPQSSSRLVIVQDLQFCEFLIGKSMFLVRKHWKRVGKLGHFVSAIKCFWICLENFCFPGSKILLRHNVSRGEYNLGNIFPNMATMFPEADKLRNIMFPPQCFEVCLGL